jgi:hypothetical protein
MKDSIVNVLEDFEKLAYKILMWVILVPKTIIKTVVDPEFVPGYVRDELKSEKQFDEYISPMLLYLGTTLLPAIAIYFIPIFGMTLLTPQENVELYYDAIIEKDGGFFSVSDPAVISNTPTFEENLEIAWHNIEFRAEASTKSDTNGLYHRFRWEVWECGTVTNEGYCAYDTFYIGEIHDEMKGVAYLSSADRVPLEEEWYAGYAPSFPDRNSVIDTYISSLEPGEYQVVVTASNYDIDMPENFIESYTAVVDLYAPFNPAEPVYYANYSNTRNSEEKNTTLSERLESGETIVLGLILLLPPLLLAAAISIFSGEKQALGEENLKEHFYAQCYYFVPVGLAFWGWYYSSQFHTPDLPVTPNFLIMPFILALLWFIVVEINSISQDLQSKSKLGAFFVLSGCFLVMFVIVVVVALFLADYNLIRKSAILSYPVVSALLALSIFIGWYRRRRKPKDQE